MEFDTRLDYLTVTTRCQKEWRAAVAKIHSYVDVGKGQRPWHFLKYSGYTVSNFDGHISWGASSAGGIVQASGELAHRLATGAERWLPQEFRVTRLDLACTFSTEKPTDIVRDLWAHPREGWRVVLPEPSKGGGTLYIGNRTSDRFGRIYDKGAQLNDDLPDDAKIPVALLWRAEVEYKGRAAREAYDVWRLNITCDQKRKFICDTVLSWFMDRGAFLPVIPTERSIVSVASRGIDDIRSIRWLHEQVRPVLYRLSGNGKGHEAARALGLAEGDLTLDLGALAAETSQQFSFFDKISV